MKRLPIYQYGFLKHFQSMLHNGKNLLLEPDRNQYTAATHDYDDTIELLRRAKLIRVANGRISLTSAAIAAIARSEPAVTEKLFREIYKDADRSGIGPFQVNSMSMKWVTDTEFPEVNTHLANLLHRDGLIHLQDDGGTILTTRRGFERFESITRPKGQVRIFGLQIDLQKIAAEATHQWFVKIAYTAMVLATGMFAKDWIVHFWTKLFH